MAANFMRILFGKRAEALQEEDGSRGSYAKMIERREDDVDRLTARELTFMMMRDSFYMATITDDDWPYIQHRGGPRGFLKHIEGNRIGFSDYGGNRQFVSAANIDDRQRIALFLMDYPEKRRLKIVGTAHWQTADQGDPLWDHLVDPAYPVENQRFFLIDVLGFDWNCPQHITPRYTQAELKALQQ
ncbi:pyridoxamine 5'-phosphate oxidase family protein [Parerythrobacter jejuensis]|uniref:Pyridoxamine 5'-phosphate oxidase family protein n=1 Tax=Parerythrobacter jejuensis TaxID=795812 RepID=A0A845AVI0_9SPHN|nr:pyridoxamine 5'-phosphate oxidase family protein [Parerythrobacter jejuensis]MXP30355.1 pyridoxamine 5'-phosphate oxidase family protein [Parerythrobacter jejuensis]MXP33115.1 pyridoxamine 5'-phosphate oxidase family protein [Parerythrobacter jejuensis]